MKKLWKFINYITRDILIWKSYKTQAVLGILSGFLGLLQFGFMGRFIAQDNYFPMIEQYGGNILAYFISGSVFMSYTTLSLTTFKSVIRQEQVMGTIEYLLLSETPLWEVFIYTIFSKLVFTILNTGIVFIFLIYTFDVEIKMNIIASIILLIITMISLSGIGLLSAGFIVITKKGDPISWIYSFLTGMFSGIYYPVEILPKWLRGISYILPTTYAMDGLRKTLIKGYSLYQIKEDIIILIIMTIIILPIGIYWFKNSFDKARKYGTISQY
ncbi:ABC transporter permease [Marinitoga lauensis]|uniref:ABC transporter permease n=1 Tax=Marinitoga lauensis TaxID=2201189 RepID=UPI001012DAAB|nr:ABC transporter permease [Marinitoga lauensis]